MNTVTQPKFIYSKPYAKVTHVDGNETSKHFAIVARDIYFGGEKQGVEHIHESIEPSKYTAKKVAAQQLAAIAAAA